MPLVAVQALSLLHRLVETYRLQLLSLLLFLLLLRTIAVARQAQRLRPAHKQWDVGASVGHVAGSALPLIVGRVVDLAVLRLVAASAIRLLIRLQLQRRRVSLAQMAVLTFPLHHGLVGRATQKALVPAAVGVVTLDTGPCHLVAEMGLFQSSRVVVTGEAQRRRLLRQDPLEGTAMGLVASEASLLHGRMLHGKLFNGRVARQTELGRGSLQEILLGRGMRQVTFAALSLLYGAMDHLSSQLGNHLLVAPQTEERSFLLEKRPPDQTVGTVASRAVSRLHRLVHDGTVLSDQGLVLGMTVEAGLALSRGGSLRRPRAGQEKRDQQQPK